MSGDRPSSRLSMGVSGRTHIRTRDHSIAFALLHVNANISHTDTVILYRPVGQAELDLINTSGYRRFPPRLSFQPIFYPVLDYEYAEQIARDWNTKDPASGFVGYVTRFAMERSYLDRYQIQVAGAARHREYWIPAEDLEEFNSRIVGLIEVVADFRNDPLR